MNLINTVSLITAFFGGMVALFAPCCITFLLPNYLANIFRSKTNVLLLTIIFGLGIASILVPTALGIRAVGQFFQNYHTQTYIFGGAFMILLGLMELTNKKIALPMLNLSIDLNTHQNPAAVYLLGVFSGLTSSCCTPVLAGILTLSFLSPNFFWAGLAGISYVFGMVVPLVVLALLIDRVDWKKITKIKGKTIKIAYREILVTEALAGIIFIVAGIIFIILALSGQITMGTAEPLEQTLGNTLMNLVRFLRAIPGSEFVFAIFVIICIIFIIKKGGSNDQKNKKN